MKSSPVISRKLPSLTAASLVAAAGMLVLALFALPQPAQACCTATVCSWCSSSSRSCVCGAHTPVCNIFACNCNVQCGEYNVNILHRDHCVFNPTCSSAAARAGAQARFDEIDADHDGKVSRDESLVWLQKQKTSWLTRVNNKELPANLRGAKEEDVFGFEFNQVDANKDGYIQPGELDASLAAPAKKGP
jgi:hypothetical protein